MSDYKFDDDVIPLELVKATPKRTVPRPVVTTPLRTASKCANCGYAMKGLPTPRCPECGTMAKREPVHAHLREDSSRIAREAYLKPLLMFVIAAGIYAALQFMMNGPADALGYLVRFAIEVPIGVGVFFLCCLLWLGFDAPMHLTALRLAGIYAVVDLVGLGASFIPIPIVGWAITLLVYIGMLSETLEMELSDAVLVGFLTFIVKVSIGIAIIFLMMNSA